MQAIGRLRCLVNGCCHGAMAKVLAEKGYHYQFVFARNAVHVDRPVVRQTLAEALQYLWQGYPSAPVKH